MASPARIKAAIERGRGALYERIRWETERWALKHFPQYAPRQRGIVAGPHPGNRGCKICGRAHSAASHRSHGPGAFKQRGERVSPRMQGDLRVPAEVPDWVRNPVEIYPPTRGVVISGMRKGPGHPCGARCRAVGHRFRHRFPEGVRIVGNRDGTVTLQKAV